MSISIALVVTSVITLAFAIVYAERRVRTLAAEAFRRDECLRLALLLAAHRSGDAELVEVFEGYGSEDDDVATAARREAFDMSSDVPGEPVERVA